MARSRLFTLGRMVMRQPYFLRVLTCLGLTAAAACATAADRPRWTMMVDLGDRQIEGLPLAWSNKQVLLLGRDGRLWDFPPAESRNFRKVSASFSSYSPAEMRAGLERELRGRLVVTGTGHYLVAHPPGGEAWARRFEELYRSCVHYFSRREMRVSEPSFPLVAIVWGKRDEFVRYAATQGTLVTPNMLGFYSPQSNRVMLYDQYGGAARRGFQANDATIIHEATHQVAFNTGVHNRFSPTPRWVAEGLGTMFEAPGVWNWRDHPHLRERVNRDQLAQFRAWQKQGRPAGYLTQLLGSDRQFESNPAAAYAEAWAWTFFLTEKYPRQFAGYVRRTASRTDFEDYPQTRRLADFTDVFTLDLRILEKHFLNFIAELN